MSLISDERIEELLAKEAEFDRLKSVLEEFADIKHHNPPVPLWISMKARKALGKEG